MPLRHPGPGLQCYVVRAWPGPGCPARRNVCSNADVYNTAHPLKATRGASDRRFSYILSTVRYSRSDRSGGRQSWTRAGPARGIWPPSTSEDVSREIHHCAQCCLGAGEGQSPFLGLLLVQPVLFARYCGESSVLAASPSRLSKGRGWEGGVVSIFLNTGKRDNLSISQGLIHCQKVQCGNSASYGQG